MRTPSPDRTATGAASGPTASVSHEAARGAIRIGTQGWNYDAWVGPFYPSGTRAGDFLSLYARAFDTVEVDSTFYAIPAGSTVRGWADRTPAHFRFALKLPQEVTHERRLRDAEHVASALFFDRARELGPKLGPVLVQLGPDFGARGAARARELPAVAAADVRFAVEFRQRGWITGGVLALLAEHRRRARAHGRALGAAARTMLALRRAPDGAVRLRAVDGPQPRPSWTTRASRSTARASSSCGRRRSARSPRSVEVHLAT